MIQELTFVKTFMHELYICTTTCPYEYRYAAAIGNCAHSQNLLDIRIIMQIKSMVSAKFYCALTSLLQLT